MSCLASSKRRLFDDEQSHASLVHCSCDLQKNTVPVPNLCPPFADQMFFFLQKKNSNFSLWVFPCISSLSPFLALGDFHLDVRGAIADCALGVAVLAVNALPQAELRWGTGMLGQTHSRCFFFGWITGGYAYDPMRFLMQIFWWISMSKSY